MGHSCPRFMTDDNKTTITVRGCALDSGTLTTDTGMIRHNLGYGSMINPPPFFSLRNNSDEPLRKVLLRG